MNENLNLVEILKDCPIGTKFYTPVWGEVSFRKLLGGRINAISIDTCMGNTFLTKEGCNIHADDTECIIFPSKEQRDWSKFTAPWNKKDRFDPKTIHPFDKVLVRDIGSEKWSCGLFSYIVIDDDVWRYSVGEFLYTMCIPYNNETKYLVGTTEEAPEYYRYWED